MPSPGRVARLVEHVPLKLAAYLSEIAGAWILARGEKLNLETLQASMRREELSFESACRSHQSVRSVIGHPTGGRGRFLNGVFRISGAHQNETGLDLLIAGRIGQLERDSG